MVQNDTFVVCVYIVTKKLSLLKGYANLSEFVDLCKTNLIFTLGE